MVYPSTVLIKTILFGVSSSTGQVSGIVDRVTAQYKVIAVVAILLEPVGLRTSHKSPKLDW